MLTSDPTSYGSLCTQSQHAEYFPAKRPDPWMARVREGIHTVVTWLIFPCSLLLLLPAMARVSVRPFGLLAAAAASLLLTWFPMLPWPRRIRTDAVESLPISRYLHRQGQAHKPLPARLLVFLSSFCSVTIDLCELRFPLEPSTGLRLRSGCPNFYKY
jgi:hypothetical protein